MQMYSTDVEANYMKITAYLVIFIPHYVVQLSFHSVPCLCVF